MIAPSVSLSSMIVVCSYCGVQLGQKPPLDCHDVSHSICEPCAEYFRPQWMGLSIGAYLEGLDEPVLVVDPSGQVAAANQRMAKLLGKKERDTVTLLGGDFMECVYARLPEGCGRTEHCVSCGVRQAVFGTLNPAERHDASWLISIVPVACDSGWSSPQNAARGSS